MVQVSISANVPDAFVDFIESAATAVDKVIKGISASKKMSMLEISYGASLAASTYTILTGNYLSLTNVFLTVIAYSSSIISSHEKSQENPYTTPFNQLNPREKKLFIASGLNIVTNYCCSLIPSPTLNTIATLINALFVADFKVSKQS